MRKRLQKILKAIYSRDVQYIRGRIVHGPIITQANNDRDRIESRVVESSVALQPFENSIPNSFRDSANRLKIRLNEGCIVIFALGAQSNEIIGYILAERGVFSALGRKIKISPDILFGHYIEVLSGYRNLGVAKFLLCSMDEYCAKHGISKYCGSVSSRNSAAMAALARKSNEIVGKIERISFFRGMLVWQSSESAVKTAIEAIGKTPNRLKGTLKDA